MGFVPLAALEQSDRVTTARQGFVPLADATAKKTPLLIDNPILRDLALKNPVNALEAGVNLASQAVSVPASGLAGLAVTIGRKLGLTDHDAVDTIANVGEALTYQPRTPMGKTATEIAQYPFEKLAEGGNWVGRKVQDVTDSPILATVADTAVNSIPMLIGPAIKAGKSRFAKGSERSGFTPVDDVPPATPFEPMAQPRPAAEPTVAMNMGKPKAETVLATERMDVPREPVNPKQGFTPLADTLDRPGMHHGAIAASVMPNDGIVNSFAPGANYVGFIDDTPRQGGAMPSTGAAQAPKPGSRADPLRREDILIDFAKALDTGIYEGRVNKKGVMGFFRPAREEVRIKRHADLETAAHEMAHLIDARVPEVRQSWKEGADAKAITKELKGLSYDQSKVYEGFAEFVRHYMTQPDVAQIKAPTFYKWFEDFFAKHQYGDAIGNARKGMQDWFNQGALDRARSKIGQHRPMNDALNSRWDSFRQATVDDLHGIYRMEQDLSGKILPNGPYESARLSRASASIADGALRYGAPAMKADGSFVWKGKGLEEILKPVSKSLDDALLYFVGRSAAELMSQGREHLFTRGEIKAMLDLRRPEFDQAFKEYQAWNKHVLDFAEAQGVINPAARFMWQRLEYMPFHRIGQPGGFKGKPGDWSGVKALTGGSENLRDILANMTSNAAMLIDKAVKNEARTKIAELSEQAKGGKFMVKIPAESRPVKIARESVIDAILKGMGIDRAVNHSPEVVKIENRLRKLLADSPEMIDMLQTNMPPAGGNVVAVLKGGKPVWYEVNDPILLRALEAIDRQPPPWIVKWLGLPKRIGQATITLTPDFMIANIARDTIAGSVMSQHGFKPVVDSLRGMAMRIRDDPLYREFIANGGGLSSIYLDEAKFRAKLEKFYNSQGVDYRTVLDTPEKFLGFVETLGDAFEMSTRLGEYRRAIEAGENPRHAAYAAREVSTDFAMRGDSRALGFLYDTVMFLKPALLSWDRLYRGLAHDPQKGAIATKAGMIALSSSMLYLLNRGNPLYEQLPDWDKDANWHFFVGDQHFRYPKIWEIGAMASMAERGTAAVIDADPKGMGKDFARIIANTYSVNLTPQIIAPMAEQLANNHFFSDTPIETEGMKNLQPFLRAKENTSETLKQLGMATRNLPEAMQVNPVRAEALLRGYFNTWATYGLMLTDKALMDKNAPTLRTDQLPVVRRFYQQEPAQHTKYETMFYDLLGEARRVQGTMRELDKNGQSQIADEVERNPLAREANPLEIANKHLQSIQKDMRQVRRDGALSPDEKRDKLDGLIIERNDLLKRSVEDAKASLAGRQVSPPVNAPSGFQFVGNAKDTGQPVYQAADGKRYTID